MNRTNLILLAVLLVQGACIGYQQLQTEEAGVAGARGLLLDGLVVEDVTGVVIAEGGEADEGEETSVSLTKTAAGWTVAERWDHPADADKLDELLRELAALEVADVVSVTGLHQVELGVAEDDFTKRVTLKTGAGDRTLYLGSSGRGGSTHTRVGGEERVLAVRDFSSWRVNAKPDSWVQRTVVDVDPETVSGLEIVRDGAAMSVTREGEGWLVDGLPADGEAVDKLLKKAAKQTLSTVKGAAGALGGELLQVRLTTPDGATTYRVAAADEKEKFLLAVDGGTHIVEVGKWGVEAILEATAESLAAEIPMEAPDDGTGPE